MKTTLQLEELELVVEYTHHESERGERDSLGVPMEPDHDEYIEIESINEADPEEFCDIHNLIMADIEADILAEHYDDLPF